MSDLGWRADGIERAIQAGGVELESYRRPGFVARTGVRRSMPGGGGSSGISVDADPFRYEDDDTFFYLEKRS